jgi:hypothetical protein
MRAACAVLAAVLAWGVSGEVRGRAGVDTTVAMRTSMELVVFEHPDCTSCPIFRSRIAPQYRQSRHESEAPLRFVDVTGPEADGLRLASPITMVPTAVVMKDGREFDRIAGYWAPDNFFKMVTFILSRAE